MGFPAELVNVGEGGQRIWHELEGGTNLHMWPEVWRFEDGAQKTAGRSAATTRLQRACNAVTTRFEDGAQETAGRTTATTRLQRACSAVTTPRGRCAKDGRSQRGCDVVTACLRRDCNALRGRWAEDGRSQRRDDARTRRCACRDWAHRCRI
jgi:hypothetical protein